MSVRVTVRSDPARDQTVTPQGPEAAASSPGSWKRLARGRSLSRFHTIIGTLAGITSIASIAFSLVQTGRAATTPSTGNLVAIVKAAGGRQSVPDATIEVLTTQNAIVATLTPDATGRATQELREGVYVVRISHPHYAAEVRRVQVVPRQTVEVRASLRAGSSSPMNHTIDVDHALNGTVTAVRRAFRF
jgi:hypothetical protein